MSLMFALFRDKGITPGQFYAMPPGEKLLLAAFMQKIYDSEG